MTVLKVKEMSCSHCVSRIHSLMKELQLEHEVNLENKTVLVGGDKNAVKKAIEELEDIGFTAEEI